MKEIVINSNDANQRLDKFLTKFMPQLPKNMLYKSLRKNCVRVNGKHIKNGDYVLNEGDVLSLYFKDEFFTPLKKIVKTCAVPDIVYEDENIILVNKKIGTSVHAGDKDAGDTLIDIITSYLSASGSFDSEKEHSFSPALCNRLDRNTSGIVIAAKNAAALREINEKIRSREIKKLYLCIADGHMEGSGVLTSHLTRHEKRVSVSDTPSENSKPIKTAYTVLASNEKNSLLEIELMTGRTHQIRAQLSHIGHPLTGDKKYNSAAPRGYSLCAYKVIFSFAPSGGVIDYLSGKEFSVSVDFAKKFSSQNS